MKALRAEHELAIGFESWAGFRLGEHVGLECCPLDVFQFDHMTLHLFNHVVNACEEMFAPFVISGELLCQCDQRFVIDI